MNSETGGSLEGLAPEERLAQYRALAAAAHAKSLSASSAELREGYLKMGTGWQALAEEMERQLHKQIPPLPSNDESGEETGAERGQNAG